MKKYTIVYTDHFMSGSHHQTLINLARVSTDDLNKLIATDARFDGGTAVVAIFSGHRQNLLEVL